MHSIITILGSTAGFSERLDSAHIILSASCLELALKSTRANISALN
jgi:hypothetical protein